MEAGMGIVGVWTGRRGSGSRNRKKFVLDREVLPNADTQNEVIWMECEMCGREGAGYVAIVEGAKLKVCEECSKMGKVVSEPRGYSEMRGREGGAGEQKAREEPEIVEDYGRRMKKAREKMGVPLSVIAEKISEKESYLRRIENEAVMPDEHLARKIEHELSIKLFEEAGEKKGGVAVSKKGEGGLSLWDLAEMQKKKKEEGK